MRGRLGIGKQANVCSAIQCENSVFCPHDPTLKARMQLLSAFLAISSEKRHKKMESGFKSRFRVLTIEYMCQAKQADGQVIERRRGRE